ncbi:MAG TPA: hypothetical protein VG408_05010, partial [Actinomycetota bacterium]|nr:hypothetical protein [Actinomycetota bacterium]
LDELDPAEVRSVERSATQLEELARLHPESIYERMFDWLVTRVTDPLGRLGFDRATPKLEM